MGHHTLLFLNIIPPTLFQWLPGVSRYLVISLSRYLVISLSKQRVDTLPSIRRREHVRSSLRVPIDVGSCAQLNDKDQSMLDERIKRSAKSRPPPPAAAAPPGGDEKTRASKPAAAGKNGS